MKQKQGIEEQSGFWVKLIGVLIAVGIVVVLVFGGFQNVLSQVTALQRQIDVKGIEFDVVSEQLAEVNREVGLKSSELDSARSKLAELRGELESTRAALSLASSQLVQNKSMVNALESQITLKTQELGRVSAELVRSLDDLAQSQSLIDMRNDEIARLRSQLHETESTLSITQDELAFAQNELEQESTELSQCNNISNQRVVKDFRKYMPPIILGNSNRWVQDLSREDEVLDISGNPAGLKIYYIENMWGGRMSLSLTEFEMPTMAEAYYENVKGMRPELRTGSTIESYPQPNWFGSGHRNKAVAIFRINNFFLEVNVEHYYGGNPLLHLSREVVRTFEENRYAVEVAIGRSC